MQSVVFKTLNCLVFLTSSSGNTFDMNGISNNRNNNNNNGANPLNNNNSVFNAIGALLLQEVQRAIHQNPNFRRVANAGAALVSSISVLGGAALRFGEAAISTAASAVDMSLAVGAVAVDAATVGFIETLELGRVAHTSVQSIMSSEWAQSVLGRRRRVYYSEFCLICREEPPTIMIKPCRHVVMCEGCLAKQQQHKAQAAPNQRIAEKCFACNGPVRSLVHGIEPDPVQGPDVEQGRSVRRRV